MPTVAVTGSTGFVGGRVAQALSGRDVPVRLLVRDESRAPAVGSAEVRAAAYEEVSSMRRALAGVDTVFMVAVGEDGRRLDLHADFLSAAVQADVRQVVYLSYLGSDASSAFAWNRDHALTEQLLHDLDLDHTVLRASHFDTTMLEFAVWGDITGPAGQGRVTPIARTDVADVVIGVLTDPHAHAGRTYELTGPEALTFDQVAEVVAQHRGAACRYHDVDDAAFRSRLRDLAVPDSLVSAWIDQYHQIRDGVFGTVSPHAEQLLGHPPLTLAASLATLDQ